MMRAFFPAHGSPCPKCGARPDLACPHRPVDETYIAPVQDDEANGRSRPGGGQGLNFGKRKVISGGGLYPLGDVLRNRRRKARANDGC